MIADVRFLHYFLALLTLIASVITIIMELFIDKLVISHLSGASTEFTTKFQVIVAQLAKPDIPVVVGHLIELAQFMLFNLVFAVKCSASTVSSTILESLFYFLAVTYHLLIPRLHTLFIIRVATLANEEAATYAIQPSEMRHDVMAYSACNLID